jgi:hypothetical protein
MTKIADLKSFYVESIPAAGDTSTTIADLAMFVEFDMKDAKRYDTSVPCIAYEALEDEYGAFEKTAGNADYYDGAWMTFKDGSTIRIYPKS